MPSDVRVSPLDVPLSLTPRLLGAMRAESPTAERIRAIVCDIRRELVDPVVGERHALRAALRVYEKLPFVSAARQEILATFVEPIGEGLHAATDDAATSADRWAKKLRGKERVLFEQAVRQHIVSVRLLLSIAPRARDEAIKVLAAPLRTGADMLEAFFLPLAFGFERETKPLRPAVRAILVEQLESASLHVYKAAVALAERFPPSADVDDDRSPLPAAPPGWIPGR